MDTKKHGPDILHLLDGRSALAVVFVHYRHGFEGDATTVVAAVIAVIYARAVYAARDIHDTTHE